MQHHITLVSHAEQHNYILIAFIHVGLAHPNYYVVARLSLLCCKLSRANDVIICYCRELEEAERVIAKNLRQGESPTCTKIKHILQGLQFHDL